MGDTDEPKGDVVTPEDEKAKTPEQEPTLTPEVEALVTKANAALTNVGRLEAELKRTASVAEAAIKQAKGLAEEMYRKQEEDAKDDPDELSRIREQRQDSVKQAELDDKETKVNTQLANLLKVNAKSLSGQYNVSEETLLKYAGQDADGMEELAKSYGERKSGETAKTRMTEAPDDGKTKGGGAGLTKEDVQKMSPQEQHDRRAEIAALTF